MSDTAVAGFLSETFEVEVRTLVGWSRHGGDFTSEQQARFYASRNYGMNTTRIVRVLREVVGTTFGSDVRRE